MAVNIRSTIAIYTLMVFLGTGGQELQDSESVDSPSDDIRLRGYLPNEQCCPGVANVILMKQVNWGVPYRAYLTAPDYFSIEKSSISGAGLGVISCTFIKKYSWLGYYEGDLLPANHTGNLVDYAWVVTRDSTGVALIDGTPVQRSNYLRFVNMPNKHLEENVIPLDCYTKIYYLTLRDILPGEELFVYYGEAYAVHLVDLNKYFDVPLKWRELGLDLNNTTHIDWLWENSVSEDNLQEHDPSEYKSDFEKFLGI